MHVLLITNLYPTPTEPTRGIFVYQFVKRLRAHCDVTVVCPLPWFPGIAAKLGSRWRKFAEVPSTYRIDDVQVFSPKYLMIPRISEAIHAILMGIGLIRCVKRLVSSQRVDVINAQWLYPDGVAATWISSRLGIPSVLTALGSDVNVFIEEPSKWKQVAWSLNMATAITTVSIALKKRLVESSVPESKITAIPNGVDGSVFRILGREECRKRLNVDPDMKAIVFVGRLVPIKGIPYLLEAAHQLMHRNVEFVLYLVGDGDLREDCLRRIKMLGLQSRAKLVGTRPHEEIASWMGASDVMCLPSLQEGYPNVVLESLFSGRPVVASDTGGIPEMVNASNGYLVEPGNSVTLGNALEKALSCNWDPLAIRESVGHLTWEACAMRFHEVLLDACKSRGA